MEIGVHILLIENDRDIREVVTCILEEAEYAVLSASNVSDGLRLARENPYIGVVLVDIHLGDRLTGLEILGALRERLPRAELILVSADWDALEKGVPTARVLRKPCGRSEILGEVSRACAAFQGNGGVKGLPTVIRRRPRAVEQ
jgi:DNA-binding NtrC family response regulator